MFHRQRATETQCQSPTSPYKCFAVLQAKFSQNIQITSRDHCNSTSGRISPIKMQGLFQKGRGRRAKKKAEEAKKGKKKSPALLRVQTDLDELELPNNARVILVDPENIQTFKVSVTPDGGYWKGATYTFNFAFPDDYPIKPPKVTCDNKIYHPNIDLQGNVCLNLLKADWRPILSTQQIIHGLIFLFLVWNIWNI